MSDLNEVIFEAIVNHDEFDEAVNNAIEVSQSVIDGVLESDDFGESVKDVLKYELDYYHLAERVSEKIVFEVTSEDLDETQRYASEIVQALSEKLDAAVVDYCDRIDDAVAVLSQRLKKLEELLLKSKRRPWWRRFLCLD